MKAVKPVRQKSKNNPTTSTSIKKTENKTVPISKEGWLLIISAFILAALGLVMIFSVTSGQLLSKNFHSLKGFSKGVPSTTVFLYRHGIYLVIAFAGLLIASRLSPGFYKKYMKLGMFVSFALLVLVIFFGQQVNGARRWFRISYFSLQPMEIAKLALILYLAVILQKRFVILKDPWRGFGQPMVVTGFIILLLLIQNDFGSAMLFLTVAATLLFIAGSRLYYFVFAATAALPFLWYYVAAGWRLNKRIIPFLYPQYFKQEAAYQIIRSLDAYGSGGLTGFGLGNGPYKMDFLPEAHTDYIASMIGQEFGFFGSILIIILYGIIMYSGVKIAWRHHHDIFKFIVTLGVTLMLVFQAIINLSVVMNLIPSKGITLPFVSWGGNSLIMSFVSIGIIISIDRSLVTAESVQTSVSKLNQNNKSGVKLKKSATPLSESFVHASNKN
ncbi:MAG: FtsW/RodA/SpoVE family cell cycle protein [Myxococcota bacterium]